MNPEEHITSVVQTDPAFEAGPERVYHLPVMVDEVLEGLQLDKAGTYVDATFGGGGHSRAIMERLGDEGRLLAFDQDEDARMNALDDSRFTLIDSNFRYMRNHLRLYGVRQVDGILADLGVSSHQLDEASRGFSTRFDGELDLRMDRRAGVSARDLVNTLDEAELTRIFRLYGELTDARQLARAIVSARSKSLIETTFDLRDAVSRHLPRGMENKRLAMIFQALRIEVNGELDALREFLQQSIQVLRPGGRLVVISYHSLEDRLVKNFMKTGNFEGELEKDFYGRVLSPVRMVSHGAVKAGEAELARNNRSRSARLRVGEKVANMEEVSNG